MYMVSVVNPYDRSQHHLLQVDFILLLKYYWKRFPLKGDICVKPRFALGHRSLSLDLQCPTPQDGWPLALRWTVHSAPP